jgi:hypothetical protein
MPNNKVMDIFRSQCNRNRTASMKGTAVPKKREVQATKKD